MTTNTNNAPWYDDFSTDKDFHQILFKPGYPVQARELTQVQSILRDQIAKFGNHIFKHGSVVIPGNSNSDLNVCYVKLQTTTNNVTTLEGKNVVGVTSGLRGIIRKGLVATLTDPATLYVSYYNSGVNGEKLFLNNEELNIDGVFLRAAVLNATGGSSMAFLAAGVFYVNGSFVSVAQQSIVIGKYTTTPSCHVLLKITESIVNSDEDSTLLDPAQGSYNYAAPGADRLKITLTLMTLELSATIDNNYIEIMRYNGGVLEEHLRYPKYSELEKSLARRTFDESGDYVVNGLNVRAREHLKSSLNGGRYNAPTGDDNKLIVTTLPGKAYVQGYEQELIAPYELTIDKARGSTHLKTITTDLVPSYGQTFYVANITGLPNFLQRTTVDLYNSNSGGVIIGTAQVISLDYYAPNTTDTNAIFKLCVSNVTISGGYDIADVGRIAVTGGNFTVLNKIDIISSGSTDFVIGNVVTYNSRTATVHKYTRASGELFVFKHSTADMPLVGDTITSGTAAGRINSISILSKGTSDNLLVELPTDSTYRVKNSVNASDITYKIYYETTVSTNSSGAGSFSVTGMTIDPKETGNFIISSSNGTLLPIGGSVVTVAPDGLSVSFTGATASTNIKILCAATKTAANAAPKTKSLVTAFSESGLVSSSTVQLSRADVIRVVSITTVADGDVTSRFTLDNGQRDYAYLLGSISLNSGVVQPTGTLTVVYDYFTHNAGSGDYFSIDSYESSGITNYYESPLLMYKSKNTGKTYDLRDVLDFRSRVGNDGTFSAGSASLGRVVQNDSRLSTSIQQYIGRTDSVVLNKDGRVTIISGTPASKPVAPKLPEGVLYLAAIKIPAYTFNMLDIRIKQQKNRVYTMKDVGTIAARLTSLEEFVLLTETENFAVNFDVIDAVTGLSRYKSGYLVDTFLDPNIIADIFNPQFKVAYTAGVSYSSGVIIPQFEVVEAPIFITATTTQFTGLVASLPYTSIEWVSQPVSSKITNINPFAVFSWIGSMVMFPSVDIWTEIENLPVIINNTTETITEYVVIRRPYSGPLPTPIWDGTPDLRNYAWWETVTPWVPMPPVPVLPTIDTGGSGSGSGGGSDYTGGDDGSFISAGTGNGGTGGDDGADGSGAMSGSGVA